MLTFIPRLSHCLFRLIGWHQVQMAVLTLIAQVMHNFATFAHGLCKAKVNAQRYSMAACIFLHYLPGAVVTAYCRCNYKFCQIGRVCRVLPTLANHKTGQHTGQRQAFPHVDALVTAAYKPFGFGTTFSAVPEPLGCCKVLQLWVSEQRHQQQQL